MGKYIYNGKQLNEPNNVEELAYEIRYDADGNASTSTAVDMVIGVGKPNDAYNEAMQWINEGKALTGLPIEIISKSGVTLLDGYIDLFRARFDEFNNRIEAAAQDIQGLQWLEQNGDAVTYDYLFEKGFIKESDFIEIPYIINRIGRNSETFLALFSAFALFLELRRIITFDIPAISARLSGVLTTIPAIIELVAFIVYLAFLFVSLAGIILELFNLIINPVKYHRAMTILQQVKAGCDFFGLTLSSSILETAPFNKAVLLPEKYTQFQGGARRFLGSVKKTESSDNGFYRGTFGQLMESLRAMFYAKIIIVDNILYFEKDNFRLGSPAFKLPPLSDEYKQYKFNAEEFESTFILEFVTDAEDQNTVLDWKGTSIQINTTTDFSIGQRYNLGRKLERTTIPFALTKRKEGLNFAEKAANTFLTIIQEVVNAILSGINALLRVLNRIIKVANTAIRALRVVGVNIRLQIPQIPQIPTVNISVANLRNGVMVIENDFVYTPKIMILDDNGKVSRDNKEILNAEYLWDNFHSFRSFTNGNQWKTYELPPIGLGDKELTALRRNNYIETDNGLEAEIITLRYNERLQVIEGEYRVQEDYIPNLILTKTIPE